MTCTSCTAKFSVFRSEKSCPECGFSFCSKCLNEKAVVAKSGSSKPLAVCRNCASVIRSNLQPKPPESTSQARKGSNDVVGPSDRNLPNSCTKANTSSKYELQNERIRQRLDALRDDKPGPAVSQAQLEDRLAMLKGMDPERARVAAQVPFRIPVDHRTPTEQTADLFAQYTEEVAIDNKHPRPEYEIAQRLAKLRGEAPSALPKKSSVEPQQFLASKNFNDDLSNKNLDDVDQLLKKYSSKFDSQAQAGLKDLENDAEIKDYMKNIKQRKKDKVRQNLLDSDEEDESQVNSELTRIAEVMKLEEMEDDADLSDNNAKRNKDDDELPYCCICNEDPVLRCIDCDRDLYCKRCFREGHDKEDEHRVIAYKVKKHSSD